uniref:Uncharacterized protein n=1 Tax=Glossina pallidipes TaxID=7398 RepID=A0A1A9ZY61_GLOPL
MYFLTTAHTTLMERKKILRRLRSDPLKSYAYNKLAGAFKRHIGCLMNGENYSIESSNALLLGAQIVGVPIFTELLLHLIFEASENPNESIKDNCLGILTLFLKSERLFDIYWNNLVALMVPLMPLLICCTFSEQLMCILLKLYDPDCQHLPPIAIAVVVDGISTMNTLFNILDTTDIEPCVRKSTLMQINVLCVNWRITADLCETGAFYLIMQALENAMQKDCDVDYPDTAIVAISILTKVLLYDAAVRCELSETPNIYILLLRALMMFVHDVQLKQDASICLFLLLFPHEIVATENSLTAPCVLGNL